jgi:anhydro-N-acetylmuramic acid kinase
MTRNFIGLSCGCSLLGVDAVLARVEGLGADAGLHVESYLHAPFGHELRELLWGVATTAAPELRQLATLHRVLGETCALAVRQLLEQSRKPASQISCIGFPGLSLWHGAEGRFPSTLNLGMAGVLAERTGLTTLSDFSSRDLALGGQGLPLSAIVDAMLFHHPHEHRVVIHLGSTVTLVSLPAQSAAFTTHHSPLTTYHSPSTTHSDCNVIGFQAAPGTMLLDGLMRLLTNGREPYDAGGKHAVQGRCLEPLLERWMQDHFFRLRPPKCVPRHEFGPDFLSRAIEQAKHNSGNLHDVLCTMTHFVARATVHSLQNYVPAMPARVLLSGNGVRNGFLWHVLEQRLGPLPLEKTDAHGIPAQACKALAHAGLAALTMDGVPVNLPSVTGASGRRLLGQFSPGSSGNWARCLAWMAQQTSPLQAAAA